ncbi:hypothetical protein ACS0TY_032440 [Phlomoides rotata]
MKLNPRVSSSQRKSRKTHFTAPSSIRRVITSAPSTISTRCLFAKTTRCRSSVAPTRAARVRLCRCTVSNV